MSQLATASGLVTTYENDLDENIRNYCKANRVYVTFADNGVDIPENQNSYPGWTNNDAIIVNTNYAFIKEVDVKIGTSTFDNGA